MNPDVIISNNYLLLSSVERVNQKFLHSIEKMIATSRVQSLVTNYIKVQDYTNFDIGLNLFTLISKQYQKENLHSDIIKEILDPEGRHKEGDKFLRLFIEYLNLHPKGICISKNQYTCATVEREVGRIDISIKDKISKHAIIIENKINNAGDMPRQIPRYWIDLENDGYCVDGVVYLVLTGNKQPDVSSWSKEDRDRMLPKVLPICAYNENHNDLYNGWLINCEKKCENYDTVILFRQYNKLIVYQGGKNMNKPLMEDFLGNMLLDENFKTACALREMLDELPNYRRDKIIDHFRYNSLPFTRVGDWKNLAVFDYYFAGEYNYAIDVVVNKDIYLVQFFERNYLQKTDVNGITNPVVPILKEINYLDEFAFTGRRMEKQFSFPSQEYEMYTFLTCFIQALQKRELEINK